MASRSQRQEEMDKAYAIQSKAGIETSLRSTAVGIGLATIAHRFWPRFRNQTLAFKAFLVSGFTIFGLVFGAESALLAHEAQRRKEENSIRREARYELARQGLIATEEEIAKWKASQKSDNTNRKV